MKEAQQRVAVLYESLYGTDPEVHPLTVSGSGRRYYRLSASDLPVVIATVGTDRAENEDFFALQAAMKADGVNVPDVYAVSADRMCYLQQDLGDNSLFSMLVTSGQPFDAVKGNVEKAVKELAALQTGLRTFGTAQLIRPSFDGRLVMWDLNYFKYCFLKPMEINFDENGLEDDFVKMTQRYTACDPRLWGFMYRDCQSRNIMVYKGALYWIDFQGGRPGPMTYDVVSLLWQARAGFSAEIRADLVTMYAAEVSRLRGIPCSEVEDAVYDIVPLRVLQTMGAYGFRGMTQRKSHFIKSIPAAISSLHQLCRQGVLDIYPEIKKISDILWHRYQTDL